MKLTHLSIQNYLGARSIELPLSAPVTLLAAPNRSGKSSTLEAIRHAIGGDAARVSLKKEFGALLTTGMAQGYAEITTDDGSFSVALPSGNGNHCKADGLAFVLDAQRFASLTGDERRGFLFDLMQVPTSGTAVLEKLKSRGCDAVKVDQIAAELRAGFPAAEKFAQEKARNAKSDWKATTGGGTWGKDKASGWQAPRPEETYDREQVKTAETLLAETDAEIEATNQRIGELRAAGQQRAEAEGRLDGLHKTAARLDALREKLVRDEAELAEWSSKLAALPPAGGEHQKFFGCPCCGVALMIEGGELVQYQLPKNGALDPEIEAKRKQQQDAVNLFTRSVENDRRDIAAAEAAAVQLAEIQKTLGSLPAISPAAEEAKLAELKADRKARAATLETMFAANRANQAANELTQKAAGHHADVLAWLEIAEALSPGGIPSELLAAALGPFNERLTYHGQLAQWDRTQISTDMEICIGPRERPYRLLSESEKWRADAMIAAAISEISGVRLLLIDRLDVLDNRGREDAIYWLDGMAQDGVIDSAIVAGTLKALPSGLPETIQGVWIEDGTAGAVRDAAEAEAA